MIQLAEHAVISIESPAPRSEWSAALVADPQALLEQGPKWVDALATSGWRDASRLYRFADGRVFVLPLVRRFNHNLSPQSGYAPSWGIGGIVGAGLDRGVVAAIDADLASLGTLWVHIRPNPMQGELWNGIPDEHALAITRRAHVVELADPDTIFAGFSQSTRRHVRKAAKRGIETRTFTGGAELDTYYNELFLPSVERWAHKQHEPIPLARVRARRRDPLKKLQALGDSLGDSFQLTLAYLDGQVAAGNIVLIGPNAHYTRGAMNEHAEKTGAAYGAMWHAMKQCCEAGLAQFHMGETGQSESLARYKEGFGAKAFDYHEYRYERLPFLALDQRARRVVKSIIGFKDA